MKFFIDTANLEQIKEMQHPNTNQGLEEFLKDWEKLQSKLKNK